MIFFHSNATKPHHEYIQCSLGILLVQTVLLGIVHVCVFTFPFSFQNYCSLLNVVSEIWDEMLRRM